jgi:hypothetical protein
MPAEENHRVRPVESMPVGEKQKVKPVESMPVEENNKAKPLPIKQDVQIESNKT